MKLKYLIGALGLCALLTVGVYYGKDALTTYKSVSAAVTSGNELVQEYNALVSNSASLQEQLTTAGKDICLDNTKVATMFAELEGASIISIDALEDASNIDSVLISITNPDDVAFFTDTVAAISYTFSINDASAFLNTLKTATFIADDVSIDLANSTARIIVPSSSTLFSNELTTTDNVESDVPVNEDIMDSTESDFAIPSEEPTGIENTESVSIPENSGVYDTPDDVTDSISTSDDFSTTYYVIDSTEGE